MSVASFASNRVLAARLYERAIVGSPGVELRVVAIVDGLALCTLWYSDDPREAELRLVSGMELSIPTKPPRTRIVRDDLLQEARKRHAGRVTPVWDLLRRSDVT